MTKKEKSMEEELNEDKLAEQQAADAEVQAQEEAKKAKNNQKR